MTAALASWQLLAWDTQFFGFKTARIVAESLDAARIDQICQQCQHAGVQVVYYTVPASDDQRMRLAEMQGFDLVDIRMTFEWVVGPISTQTPSTNLLIRSARPDDLARLQAIARDCYHDSRFYHDRHYPREKCDQLYAAWIARSCQSDSEHVIVAEQAGAPIGFIAVEVAPNRHGTIGLVGVAAEARGARAGRCLVAAAQSWFASQNASTIFVVTQGRNVHAQRLYQYCGFVTRSVELTYHKWFETTTSNDLA